MLDKILIFFVWLHLQIINLWQDFKERFFNVETLEGVIFIIGAITLLFSPQFFQTAIIVYLFITGFYKLFINRIKQEIVKEEMVNTRKNIKK